MREIKFKGLKASCDEWVYGYYYVWDRGGNTLDAHKITSIEDGNTYIIRPKTMGQFVSLVDENEKEIYAGDKIKVMIYGQGSLQNKPLRTSTCTVSFQGGCFGFTEHYFHTFYEELHRQYLRGMQTVNDFNRWDRGDSVGIKGIEVIGNIHQNPELLNDPTPKT